MEYCFFWNFHEGQVLPHPLHPPTGTVTEQHRHGFHLPCFLREKLICENLFALSADNRITAAGIEICISGGV